MNDERLEIIIRYLGLDEPWRPECTSGAEVFEEDGCRECSSYNECHKEITTRELLRCTSCPAPNVNTIKSTTNR